MSRERERGMDSGTKPLFKTVRQKKIEFIFSVD
jgi:hypothetical protein